MCMCVSQPEKDLLNIYLKKKLFFLSQKAHFKLNSSHKKDSVIMGNFPLLLRLPGSLQVCPEQMEMVPGLSD